MESECWKFIPDYEGLYKVSDKGRVMSTDMVVNLDCITSKSKKRKIKGRVLKPFISHGYNVVSLCKNGVQKKYKVSRLVLYAFESVKESEFDACHNDGNRQNDNLENLRWGTRKENMGDAKIHGTIKSGVSHNNSRITRSDLVDIINSKLSYSKIAQKYGMSKSAIGKIKIGQTYSKDLSTIDETELLEQRNNHLQGV